MLPCIGSHAHTTGWPARFTARSSGGSCSRDLVGAHAADEHEPAGLAAGVEAAAQRDRFLGRGVGPSFTPIGFCTPGEELDVRAVELPGALADPQQVRGAVVPVAGEAVAAGERLLVAEDQRLVRRVEVDFVQLHLGREVDAARGHEAQRAFDAVGELFVALALTARTR